MRRIPTLLLTLLIGLGAVACISPSDPFGRGDALKTAQKRYTEAIRWGRFEKAASYVTPELREAYLTLSESFESLKITDVEIGEIDFDDDEMLEARVGVTYHGYTLPHFVEKKVFTEQVWVRDEENFNVWQVRPDLAHVIDQLGTAKP